MSKSNQHKTRHLEHRRIMSIQIVTDITTTANETCIDETRELYLRIAKLGDLHGGSNCDPVY